MTIGKSVCKWNIDPDINKTTLKKYSTLIIPQLVRDGTNKGTLKSWLFQVNVSLGRIGSPLHKISHFSNVRGGLQETMNVIFWHKLTNGVIFFRE